MAELYYDLELKLSMVLAEMELTGIQGKGESSNRFGEELIGTISRIEQEIYGHGGCGIQYRFAEAARRNLVRKAGTACHQEDEDRLFNGCGSVGKTGSVP